jgi:hypothetical protein
MELFLKDQKRSQLKCSDYLFILLTPRFGVGMHVLTADVGVGDGYSIATSLSSGSPEIAKQLKQCVETM